MTTSLAVFSALLLVLPSPARSQVTAPTAIRTDADYDRFVQGYYRSPAPDRVGPAIEFLSAPGALRDEAMPGVVGFLAEVFAANRARRAEWVALAQRKGGPIRSAVMRAADLADQPGGALHLAPPSASLNDLLWGGFFGSGSTGYLDKLIEHALLVDERRDRDLFLAGASAMWSLAANARSHEPVRTHLERARLAAAGRRQAVIADVLQKPPETIKADAVAILRAQHEKGIW